MDISELMIMCSLPFFANVIHPGIVKLLRFARSAESQDVMCIWVNMPFNLNDSGLFPR